MKYGGFWHFLLSSKRTLHISFLYKDIIFYIVVLFLFKKMDYCFVFNNLVR